MYVGEFLNIAISGISVFAVLITAITSIVNLKKIKLHKIDIDGISLGASQENRNKPELELAGKNKTEVGNAIGFEVAKLNEYYTQVLNQAKVSFWFSLLFASIGFAVIIISAFTITDKNYSNVIAIISGVIIEAVSSLFFILSKQAQSSMREFFEKLRLDRKNVESRIICEEITDEKIKNALKAHLVLHYAELPNSSDVANAITIAKKNEEKNG